MKKTADTVIIGGGVMGASIAWNLADLGMTNSVVIERGNIGSGSTSRTMGILRMHYSNEITTKMALKSLKIIRDFQNIVGVPSGYVRTGYLLIAGREHHGPLRDNVAMQSYLGVDTEILDHESIHELYPAISLMGDEICAFEPESGYADANAMTNGYATLAKSKGSQILTETEVTGIEIKKGAVISVQTSSGSISTSTVVLATGPWSPFFFEKLGIKIPLKTIRHQVAMFGRTQNGAKNQPCIGDLPNRLSARPEGENMIMMGVGEDESLGPEDYDEGTDLKLISSSWVRFSKRFSQLQNAKYQGGWSGLFTTTPDWHPILDKVAGIGGLYCAVGFSGHGFKLSPMVGIAMAEIIVHGRSSTVDVSSLGIDRFTNGLQLKSRYPMGVMA